MQPRDLGIGRLFETIRDAVIVADASTGCMVLWNPAATALFGYTADEALRLNVGALVPESLRERHRAGLAHYRETGHGPYIDSHAVLDLPAVHQSGRELAVEMTLSPLQGPLGDRRFVLAIVRDVTARKRLEAALRASAESFADLFDATAEGIAIHEQGRHIAVNQALAAMLGYEVSELVGRRSIEMVAPESRALVAEKIRTGDERPYEVLGLRKDGSTFPTEVVGKNIRYRGRPARLAGIRDITERKRLEAALLAASENRFAAVFAASPVPLSISTLAEGRFIDVNDAFLQLTGYGREEVLGHTAEDLGLWTEPADRVWLVETLRARKPVRGVEGRVSWPKSPSAGPPAPVTAWILTAGQTPVVATCAVSPGHRSPAQRGEVRRNVASGSPTRACGDSQGGQQHGGQASAARRCVWPGLARPAR